MREELAHLLFHLLDCKVLTGVFVYLVGELGAVVNHLLHSHILRELAVLVAVDAVIFIGRAIRICAEDFIGERHSAALTEFHFHCYFYFLPISPYGQIIRMSWTIRGLSICKFNENIRQIELTSRILSNFALKTTM